jgi:hypothetical protein
MDWQWVIDQGKHTKNWIAPAKIPDNSVATFIEIQR